MLSVAKYRNTRYWAMYEGRQLLAVTVYKKGALAVMQRLQQMRGLSVPPEPFIHV